VLFFLLIIPLSSEICTRFSCVEKHDRLKTLSQSAEWSQSALSLGRLPRCSVLGKQTAYALVIVQNLGLVWAWMHWNSSIM